MGTTERCAAAAAALEASDDGVVVTDPQGGLLYQSAALRQFLTVESERGMLEESIADARNAVLARADARRSSSDDGRPHQNGAPSITLQVRTSASEYRVRGTAVHASDAGSGASMVVVWVRQCRPRHLTLDALRARYGLTLREIRVASLLAARSGSREIAEALGISPHTARRHAEAVLRKLGVRSRADVRERLIE